MKRGGGETDFEEKTFADMEEAGLSVSRFQDLTEVQTIESPVSPQEGEVVFFENGFKCFAFCVTKAWESDE